MPFHPDRLQLEAIKSRCGICLFVKQAANRQQSCSQTSHVAQAGYFTPSPRLLSQNESVDRCSMWTVERNWQWYLGVTKRGGTH